MGHKHVVPCDQCGQECPRWRSCPECGCSYEIAFCEKCGGDERAVERLLMHIATHKGR